MNPISVHSVLHTGAGDITEVEGSVVMDRSWTPYVQATLAFPSTGDDYTSPAFDPTVPPAPGEQPAPPRVVLELTRTDLVTQEVTTRTFDLVIRSVDTSYDQGVTTIRATSDEPLLDDFRPLTARSWANSEVAFIVNQAITTALLGQSPNLDAITLPGVMAPPGTEWAVGESAGDFVRRVVGTTDRHLVCDAERRWLLAPIDYVDGQPAAYDDGDYATLSASRTREGDWFDGVVATYVWTDTNDIRRRITNYVPSGQYDATKWDHIIVDWEATNQPSSIEVGRTALAARDRAALLRTERTIRIPWDLSTGPGAAVSLTRPDGTTVDDCIVNTVEWRLDGTAMLTATSAT